MRKSIFARVEGLVRRPRQELAFTIAEAGDLRALAPYLLALLGLGAAASFLSAGVFGTYMPPQQVLGMAIGGGFFRAPLRALVGSVLQIGLGLGLWWLLASLLEWLAPSFAGRADRAAARKMATWVATPVWLAEVLVLFDSVPHLGVVYRLAQLAGGCYAVLLGRWGLPLLMGNPERRALPHILSALGITLIAAVILTFVLFNLLLGALFGTPLQ